MNIKGKEIEIYKTFVVLLDNTKFRGRIDLPMRNNSVTQKKLKHQKGIWIMKKQLRIQYQRVSENSS